jgi:CheY-like chemotaxis protein
LALHKPVILCVDDEDNALVLRRGVLEKAGYTVITALSGLQALELLGVNKVDLVVSDYVMPNLNGGNLARAIKTLHPHLPVMILTGVQEIPSDATHADLFVSKTEGPAGVCAKIASLLQKAQHHRQPA